MTSCGFRRSFLHTREELDDLLWLLLSLLQKNHTASNGEANKNISSERLTFLSLAVTSCTTGCNNKKILHCAHNVHSCVLYVSQK
jgi:hypothetical protein